MNVELGLRQNQHLYILEFCFLNVVEFRASFLLNPPSLCPKEPKTLIQKNLSTPTFLAALSTITKIDTEAAQVPINRWVDKTTMGHLHNGILLVHKKEANFTLCDSVDGPGEHYTKWNKPVRDKQIP